MIKTWIYIVIHPKNAIQSFKSLSIDGPAFLLTQVRLVCPWVLHNGQTTVLVFHIFGATIDCNSILFFLLLPIVESFTLLKERTARNEDPKISQKSKDTTYADEDINDGEGRKVNKIGIDQNGVQE